MLVVLDTYKGSYMLNSFHLYEVFVSEPTLIRRTQSIKYCIII